MEVSRSGYFDTLRSRISDDERRELENGGGILISRYNRATVLRMLRDNVSLTGAVDTECAEELERTLEAYLGQYMADQPEGHKWIILCCLYLSQVVQEPLHPQQVAGWRIEDGRYYCSAREDGPGSVCKWCLCERASEIKFDEITETLDR